MAKAPEYKYMKESTYHAHYQKYLQEYNKQRGKHEFKGGSRAYQFNDFVRNYNDAYEVEVLEGRTPDKYNLYKKIAKSGRAYTDKQEKEFREVWNKKLAGLPQQERALLRGYGQEKFIYAEFAMGNMTTLITLFDRVYGRDWRAEIDT